MEKFIFISRHDGFRPAEVKRFLIYSRFAPMFERLKQKWKVGGLQLFLILCVFAIAGTSTANITRQITMWLHIGPVSRWYWVLKAVVLILGYQILILVISIPFGQFRFFWNYEKKILRWLGRLLGFKR